MELNRKEVEREDGISINMKNKIFQYSFETWEDKEILIIKIKIDEVSKKNFKMIFSMKLNEIEKGQK